MSETIDIIKKVLKEKIQPNVAMHGGRIDFVSFEEGTLKLLMAGSCSGCAMSKMTLHRGVENMMKHYVPEVKQIIAEDETKPGDEGYNPYA